MSPLGFKARVGSLIRAIQIHKIVRSFFWMYIYNVWMCVAADWEESALEAVVCRLPINHAAFDLQPSVVTAVAAVVQNYKQIPQLKKKNLLALCQDWVLSERAAQSLKIKWFDPKTEAINKHPETSLAQMSDWWNKKNPDRTPSKVFFY